MSDARPFVSVDVAAGHAPPPDPADEADILREMLLRLPDGVGYVDADSMLRLVNDALVEIHKLDRPGFARLRMPQDRFRWQFETGKLKLTHATIEESVAHMLARWTAADGSSSIRHCDGRYYDHRAIALPDGRTMVLFRDITDLKRHGNEQ